MTKLGEVTSDLLFSLIWNIERGQFAKQSNSIEETRLVKASAHEKVSEVYTLEKVLPLTWQHYLRSLRHEISVVEYKMESIELIFTC